MQPGLEQKLQQFRGRLQSGPVGKFVSWWVGELNQAMPASWQQKLQHAMRRVTLSLDGETLTIGVDGNRELSVLENLPVSGEASLQLQEVDDLLGIPTDDAVYTSAEEGTGADAVLQAGVERVPPPAGLLEAPLRALSFDSHYDSYKGVVA